MTIPKLEPVTAQVISKPLFAGLANRTPACVWIFENLDKLYAWHEATKAQAEPGATFSDFCMTQHDFEAHREREYIEDAQHDNDPEEEDDDDVEDERTF